MITSAIAPVSVNLCVVPETKVYNMMRIPRVFSLRPKVVSSNTARCVPKITLRVRDPLAQLVKLSSKLENRYENRAKSFRI